MDVTPSTTSEAPARRCRRRVCGAGGGRPEQPCADATARPAERSARGARRGGQRSRPAWCADQLHRPRRHRRAPAVREGGPRWRRGRTPTPPIRSRLPMASRACTESGDLGQGVTIGVYELEPNARSDIAAYQKCYRTHVKVSYVKVDGGVGNGRRAGRGRARHRAADRARAEGEPDRLPGAEQQLRQPWHRPVRHARGDGQPGQGAGPVQLVGRVRDARGLRRRSRREHVARGGGHAGADIRLGRRRLGLGGLLQPAARRQH